MLRIYQHATLKVRICYQNSPNASARLFQAQENLSVADIRWGDETNRQFVSRIPFEIVKKLCLTR
jgi:hypothetical protein